MIHEPASSPEYIPVARPPAPSQPALDDESNIDELATLIGMVMKVKGRVETDFHDLLREDQVLLLRGDSHILVSFVGQLTQYPEIAYDKLDELLGKFHLTPLFRESADGQHIIHIIRGRIPKPKSPRPWLNIILFLLTIFSTLMIGTVIAIGEITLTDEAFATDISANFYGEMWRGIPYMVSLMLILGIHELAHYITLMRYGVSATLPFFLPFPPNLIPNPFGTMGAGILVRSPIRNRKHLFDLGASGPIAGLVVAIPILLIGLSTSPVIPLSEGAVEGNSLLYAMAKMIVFGEFLPNAEVDVVLNQLAWAGWTGLFVTALNLIPLGQLDGGHIAYALLGDSARKLFYPILFTILFLMLFFSNIWWFMAILLFFIGGAYAVPLDNITRLDAHRRWLGVTVAVIFVLIFIPVPIADAPISAMAFQVPAPILIFGTLWATRHRFMGQR